MAEVTKRYRFIGFFVAAATFLQFPVEASEAPPQARNKTISVGYSVQRESVVRGSRTYAIERLIYVSSTGRIFVRRLSSSRRGAITGDAAPTDKVTRGGFTRNAFFQGKQLILMGEHEGTAGRLSITFDSSFSSCSVDIVIGRVVGSAHTANKTLVTSNPSCAVREGNAFGD